MGAALRAALGEGLSEAEFYRLTPYRLGQILSERARTNAVQALWIGWMSSRLSPDREQRLRDPKHYINEMFGAKAQDVSFEQQEAEFHRMAAAWGLEVVDLPMDDGEAHE